MTRKLMLADTGDDYGSALREDARFRRFWRPYFHPALRQAVVSRHGDIPHKYCRPITCWHRRDDERGGVPGYRGGTQGAEYPFHRLFRN